MFDNGVQTWSLLCLKCSSHGTMAGARRKDRPPFWCGVSDEDGTRLYNAPIGSGQKIPLDELQHFHYSQWKVVEQWKKARQAHLEALAEEDRDHF